MSQHQDSFHQETSLFVQYMMENGLLVFSEDFARWVADELGLKQLYIVYRDLRERGIIYQHHLGWAFEPKKLYWFFSKEMLN